MKRSPCRAGIDIGGTFTDFLLSLEDGTSEIFKVLSTPRDPSIATMNGLEEMAASRKLSLHKFLDDVTVIVHGTLHLTVCSQGLP